MIVIDSVEYFVDDSAFKKFVDNSFSLSIYSFSCGTMFIAYYSHVEGMAIARSSVYLCLVLFGTCCLLIAAILLYHYHPFLFPDVCTLPKVIGPCRGAFNVYYYDIYERKCQQFTYGGCQGNGNRFQSSEECERNCSRLYEPPTPPSYEVVPHTVEPQVVRPSAISPDQNPYLGMP